MQGLGESVRETAGCRVPFNFLFAGNGQVRDRKEMYLILQYYPG